MNGTARPSVSLKFPLLVEDGWPPVAVEALPFESSTEGYRALMSPLFIKDLSVGDVVAATLDDDNLVQSWHHVRRSSRTTIWLLRLRQASGIESVLAELRKLGCNSVGFESAGCYAIDVPEIVSIHDVDSALAALDQDSVAVAFPAMRHPES